ncbi:MAG TPA: 9-O-acetylesterase [Lachnospiraceae bacterium]|nr:9-O-acetylesterase [Lachnospiraceae bacterium]
MLSVAKVFQNHMVLQRNKPIRIWGISQPFAEVKAGIGTDQAAIRADADGTWMLELPPQEASAGNRLRIESDDEQLDLQDISIGEVWLAGGQSNMEFHMKFDRDFDAVRASGHFQDIRFFDVPEIAYDGEEDDYDYAQFGIWRKATPEDLAYFSAVAYYFADQIGKELNVPIGIIGCNWGGTTASSWMDPRYLENTEGSIWLQDYEENKPTDLAAYEAGFAANPSNNRVILLEDPANIKTMRDGLSREEQAPIRKQILAMAGVEDLGEDTPPLMNYGPKSEQNPGALYHHMLKTIAPYSLRGVIWYQGESDDRHPKVYATVFSQMIRCWRDLWHEELPFLFVQLAPFEQWLHVCGREYPLLRRQQELVSKTVPGVWMTTSGDAGMRWDIHPKEKRPIGLRLALLALGHIYGKDLLCDAPEFLRAEKIGKDLCLRFAHGDGLYLGDNLKEALELLNQEGNPVASIEAVSDKDTLILRGCSNAATIRYAQMPFYRAQIFNAAGIPAKPFEAFV